MQGPNLAKKHWKDILTRAPETTQERIQQIDQSRFKVQSSSSKKTYEINLLTYTCTCLDFPRIQLCKHIAATVHFFGGGLRGLDPMHLSTQAKNWQNRPTRMVAPANRDALHSYPISITSIG